ncbi:hypothetical protein GlitD10_0219 [Gloeomargarita lithophora Alchichica-D10]|uniref:Uncharacterized protein n=1 Tax=Gloeomargarita lithophora Alchichica-D10 TaxID=1188229 RepID=A0A1J0A9A6_9CYAN|nr:hypothetical protein [Gloeomargarita lithophora]APB32520.1 hypothetical protein GlitD10_0219 [Gloeomargarita lithophora Alchichica-D10]
MSWRDYFNVAGLPPGNYRSIAGYAAESLAIGRAMQCGYNLFFKAWRDSPYDGVLDYNNTLFRVEIKGTTTDSLSVTSGSRSGAQINREAEDRSHIISTEQVNFLLGVNNLNGDCYIIHAEILSIFNQSSLSLKKIQVFKEKWQTFKGYTVNGQQFFTPNDIKLGFLHRPLVDLQNIATNLGIQFSSTSNTVNWPGFRGNELSNLTLAQFLTLQIWTKILE